MLALTENASLAIEGILSASTIPDGAGLRIAAPPGEDAVRDGSGASEPSPDGYRPAGNGLGDV